MPHIHNVLWQNYVSTLICFFQLVQIRSWHNMFPAAKEKPQMKALRLVNRQFPLANFHSCLFPVNQFATFQWLWTFAVVQLHFLAFVHFQMIKLFAVHAEPQWKKHSRNKPWFAVLTLEMTVTLWERGYTSQYVSWQNRCDVRRTPKYTRSALSFWYIFA